MRAGVGLALLVASVAALLFLDLALKAADQLRSHRADASGDVETTFHSAADTTRGQQDAA